MPLQLLFEKDYHKHTLQKKKEKLDKSFLYPLSLPADQFSFPFSPWASSSETSKLWLLACVLAPSTFQEPFHPHVRDHRINIWKSHFIFSYVFTASAGAHETQKGVLDPLSWSWWYCATPVGALKWNPVLFKSSNLCFLLLFVFLFRNLPVFPDCGLMWPTIP